MPLTLYERAFFYVAAEPPAPSSPVTVMGAFTDNYWENWAGPNVGFSDVSGGTALQFADFSDTNTTTSATTTTPFPTNQWVCVEWELTRASETATVGNVTVWQDGVELGDVAQTGTSVTNQDTPVLIVNQLEKLGNLMNGPAAPTGYDVWIDDVFVDTSPVGCAK